MTAVVDFVETKSKSVTSWNDHNKVEGAHSHASKVSMQTRRVTYGGVDGAYYSSTKTTRTGGDGVSNFLKGKLIHCLFLFIYLFLGLML